MTAGQQPYVSGQKHRPGDVLAHAGKARAVLKIATIPQNANFFSGFYRQHVSLKVSQHFFRGIAQQACHDSYATHRAHDHDLGPQLGGATGDHFLHRSAFAVKGFLGQVVFLCQLSEMRRHGFPHFARIGDRIHQIEIRQQGRYFYRRYDLQFNAEGVGQLLRALQNLMVQFSLHGYRGTKVQCDQNRPGPVPFSGSHD